MLVLSRKKNQSIDFPNLGISVEILRVEGKTVRVGVEAPRDIRVLRGELTEAASDSAALEQSASQARHELRNRLNTANLALHVLQKQLEAGQVDHAEITLAKALESLSELDQLAAGPVATRRSLPTADGCRALVVEDCANERQLLAGFLELCGYQVDAVEDGVAAMDYLASHEPPDVILMDMQMPRMDGAKTITAIRSNPAYQGIKLFAVSGAEPASMGLPTGEQGVDHWFSKPLRPAEFAQDLAEEVSRTRLTA